MDTVIDILIEGLKKKEKVIVRLDDNEFEYRAYNDGLDEGIAALEFLKGLME
jgi:hypothetical protein